MCDTSQINDFDDASGIWNGCEEFDIPPPYGGPAVLISMGAIPPQKTLDAQNTQHCKEQADFDSLNLVFRTANFRVTTATD